MVFSILDLTIFCRSMLYVQRVCLLNRSVGHNYNIMDINEGKMITVEAASKGRWSVKEIGAEPFFHANMYIHLPVDQVQNLSD